MHRPILAASLLGLLALPASLEAQALDAVSPRRPMAAQGEKVRVTAPLVFRGWKTGTLVRTDGDSVLIDLEHGGGRMGMARWQVESMQRAHGRNRVTGAVRGLIVGVGVPFLAVGAASAGGGNGGESEGVGLWLAEFGFVGGVVGLVSGAAEGVQGWEKVHLPPADPAPRDPGAAADASRPERAPRASLRAADRPSPEPPRRSVGGRRGRWPEPSAGSLRAIPGCGGTRSGRSLAGSARFLTSARARALGEADVSRGRWRTRLPEAGIPSHARRPAVDPDPAGGQDAAEFELIGGEADHPDLAHWHGNVGRPVALDLAPPLAGEASGVDVLSWNLGVGTARLGEVLERLRAGAWGGAGKDPARPLVVLAQEAYRTDESVPARPASSHHGGLIVEGGQCDVVDTARDLGLSLRYAPSMRNGAERSDRGNAVFCTAALAASHAFPLPFVKQRRVAVAAELAGLEGITFVSAHLDTWGRPPRDDGWFWRFGSGRAAQASELARRIVRADGPGGVVLGADLNTPLGRRDPAVRALVRGGFTPASPVGEWGYSFRGPVRLLLDHVLYRAAHGRIAGVRVMRLDEDGPGGKRVFGSDHHPLLARVELRGA